MTPINVVGIGLDGIAGLTDSVRQIVEKATVLVGSDRYLSYFPNHPDLRIVLGNFTQVLREIRNHLVKDDTNCCIVILASGDPLFFGLGRLLLEEFPKEQLTFYPNLSAIQLAFNRVKIPWQDARVISAHGRSMEQLIDGIQQGVEKIAVLTDKTNTPKAIARLLLSLDLPYSYEFWVCENLGGRDERIQKLPVDAVLLETFAPLNVVILLRQSNSIDSVVNVEALPILGLGDHTFASFSDRPGLMTKREVRILVLGELALQPGQTVWDIGAGTGSISIEIARLCSTSQIYAIEKTAMGSALIEQNCRRLQVKNVISINGTAPDILHHLPVPNRIFIGGTGGHLPAILDRCNIQLARNGIVVLAFATLEHLNQALSWFNSYQWDYKLLQVQLSRSIPVAQLTRLTPLNPVTIVTATRPLGE